MQERTMQKIMKNRTRGQAFAAERRDINARAWGLCEIMRHKLKQKNLPDRDEQYRKLWNAVGYMTSRTVSQLLNEMEENEKAQARCSAAINGAS